MDITFSSSKLEKILNSERDIIRVYGKENGRILMRRLTVLRAAYNLNEVPSSKPERRHHLKGDRKDCFAVDLQQPYRLVFKPLHNPIPTTEDGGLDLEKILSIEILGVENYHD